MSWFIDNANVVYLLLGSILLGLGVSWWLHRRVRTLIWIVAMIGIIALFWFLTVIVPTDRKQIRENLFAMATAVMDRKPNDLVKHWSKDFQFVGLNRDELAKAAAATAGDFQVSDIHLWEFDVKSVTKDKAEIWFRCRAIGRGGAPFLAICRAHFAKEGDHWKLHRVGFYNAVANTDQEIPIPLRR